MDTIISVKNLVKNYLENKVLDDFNFSLTRGKFYALLGENGAGKSTVLRILMGIERASSGVGHVLGNPLGYDNPSWRRKVGYVAETVEYDCPLNVKKFFDWYKDFFPNWNQGLFDKIIEHQGFDLSKKFDRYSRGQKMQLVLTGELCKRPEILLVDEITSVLDVNSRDFFMELLLSFQKEGGTILMTTNIIKEIQNAATDILIIKEGNLCINSPLDELANLFVKIKRHDNNRDHPIFNHKSCHYAGSVNSTSEIFLAPKSIVEETTFLSSDILSDPLTLEDIFLYAVGKKGTDHVEEYVKYDKAA